MAPLFSAVAFIAIIAAAVSGIIWIVNKIRHRPTKAHVVCIAAALVAVAGFVAFGLTYEPPEKVEEPPQTASTEAPEETAAAPTETPAQTPPSEAPTEKPVETATEPPQATQTPEEGTTLPPTPEPTEAPTEPQEATPTPTVEPTPTPTPTEEPAPEPTEEPTPPDPVEEIDPAVQDKEEIEAAARDIVTANYTMTDISRITVNENYGTDADGDYILLVYVTWNVKNSVEMTNKVLAMYSEDFAARVGKDIPKVSEISVFWTVPYYSETNVSVKYSYERIGDGMTETGHMILIK